jgi:NADPH-dependent 7-cyano-7-deazaguanine reductase QueF
MLETIVNVHPRLDTDVRLTFPFERLCPVSAEPQPGSTISIAYRAGGWLLETKALRRYLASFAGENVYGVRDLEEAAQVIAQQCANALGVRVRVSTAYLLAEGRMDVDVQAVPKVAGTIS